MTREEAVKIINCYDIGFYDLSGEKIPADKLVEAFDMAIEALKREAHDGCDGCMYEHYEELTEPCTSCKQNYTDRYIPEPKHDIDWIVGCIKHDGFIKTDRGDKANQIILEALKADTVEIVRCKDCKRKYVSGNGTTQYYVCDFMDAQFADEGYCHHGERGEE